MSPLFIQDLLCPLSSPWPHKSCFVLGPMLMGQLPMEIYPVFLALTGTPEQKRHPESLMKWHLDSETKRRSAQNIWLIHSVCLCTLRFCGRSDTINSSQTEGWMKMEGWKIRMAQVSVREFRASWRYCLSVPLLHISFVHHVFVPYKWFFNSFSVMYQMLLQIMLIWHKVMANMITVVDIFVSGNKWSYANAFMKL